MACTQTYQGIGRDCTVNTGGIAEVYIVNFDEVTAITTSSNQVSAITMASGKKFKGYLFRKNGAELKSTPNVNPENGSAYVTSVLDMYFAKMETLKRVEMNAILLGQMRAIVKDYNGKFWLLGKDAPVYCSGGDSGTGKAMSDANGYSIQVTDESAEFPYEIAASVISNIVAEPA